MPITRETITDLARAHREVEVSEALLADVVEAISRRKEPDIRDAFGNRQGGLQLGVPSGDNSQRLFNVPWTLAKPVIEAHIANQRAIIDALSAKALLEAAA